MMGVMRGYFQGMGTMLPTAVSQIIEQVVNAIVSLMAASYLIKGGDRDSKEPGRMNCMVRHMPRPAERWGR